MSFPLFLLYNDPINEYKYYYLSYVNSRLKSTYYEPEKKNRHSHFRLHLWIGPAHALHLQHYCLHDSQRAAHRALIAETYHLLRGVHAARHVRAWPHPLPVVRPIHQQEDYQNFKRDE